MIGALLVWSVSGISTSDRCFSLLQRMNHLAAWADKSWKPTGAPRRRAGSDRMEHFPAEWPDLKLKPNEGTRDV
jgi:hypothetical protein